MKKLVHLGLVAIFAINVSSCAKSTNDLVANEKGSKNESGLLNQGKNPSSSSQNLTANFVEGMSRFFTYVNEPIEVRLGNPNSYLPMGETAVFYVVIEPDFAGELPTAAILTTMDDNTGDNIEQFNLISSDEAPSYGLNVPYELSGVSFMFALVKLDDQYTDKTITLHSEITVNGITTVAQLDHAFVSLLK